MVPGRTRLERFDSHVRTRWAEHGSHFLIVLHDKHYNSHTNHGFLACQWALYRIKSNTNLLIVLLQA
ncbi:hypothetical protein EMIT0P294_11108 [Pseudomonas sp. IT-P294]